MRAIVVEDYGTPPILLEVPKPDPGPGEVLVRVQASSINGFDVAVAAGMLKGMMDHRFPVVLGKDFAGVVEGLGEGATRFAVGDTVYGVVMKSFLGDGGLGEYLIVGEQYGIARRTRRSRPAGRRSTRPGRHGGARRHGRRRTRRR